MIGSRATRLLALLGPAGIRPALVRRAVVRLTGVRLTGVRLTGVRLTGVRLALIGLAAAGLAVVGPAGRLAARQAPENPLDAAGVEERIGSRVPLDTGFRDDRGRAVHLRDFFSGRRPVLLILAYTHCRTLCDLVLDGAARALRRSTLRPGEDYAAITVSIDPRDSPGDARMEQTRILAALGAADAPAAREHWPFLVGTQPAIRALADAVGFRYRYDPATDQFAHPAVLFILTPDGHIASYVYGVEPAAATVERALRTAARGLTLTPLDRVLLRCFHYIPALRRYGGLVAGMLRGGALLSVLALGALLVRLVRARARPPGPEPGPDEAPRRRSDRTRVRKETAR